MAEFNDMIQQINNGVNSEINALTTALNGKAKIQTGSYVGTGTYGSSNPCTLTFDKLPDILIISYYYDVGASRQQAIAMITKDCGIYLTDPTDIYVVNYAGNTISWYGFQVQYQMNTSGHTYSWCAI